MLGFILAMRWNDVRDFGRLAAIGVIALSGCALLLPYALGHLLVNDPVVANINAVVTAKLLWNHGLDIPSVARQFISSWGSYFTPNFILLRGDPNVVQSIQKMGEVGWALGAAGVIGLVVALYRRNRTDLLLLGLTAAFPIGDAITYYDAPANSVRGLSGSVLWAVWAALGLLAVWQVYGRSFGRIVTGVSFAAVAIQTLLFAAYYFGPYTVQNAYAFETGYDRIYPTLAQHRLLAAPITFHAGYQRDVMLQYFSQYRLHAATAPLACDDLPYDVVHDTALSWVLIVREDRGFAQVPGCVDQNQLIQRDQSSVLNAPPLPGKSSRQVILLAVFPNDPQGDYYTAIWYVHY
jgi:hypothetical protein